MNQFIFYLDEKKDETYDVIIILLKEITNH